MNDSPTQLRCDSGAAWDFLKSLWPDTSELILSIVPTGGSPFGRRYTVAQSDEFNRNLPSANDRLHTYFAINLPRVDMKKQPTKDEVGTIRAVFVDLDPAKGEDNKPLPGEIERILTETTDEALTAKGLPLPTARIRSGGGCWLFWALAEPVTVAAGDAETIHRFDAIGRRIASMFPHGDSCFNVNRIARLPFTVNWASLDPKKPGRPDALASVDTIDTTRRYRPEDFPEPLYEAAPPADEPTPTDLPSCEEVNCSPAESVDSLDEYGLPAATVELARNGAPKGQRSELLFGVVRSMLNHNVPLPVILHVLISPAWKISEHVRDNGGLIYARKQVKNCIKKTRAAMRSRRVNAEVPAGAILVAPGRLLTTLEESEAAMLAAGTDVYDRNHELVHAVRSDGENGDGVRIEDGSLILCPVSPHRMVQFMASAAPFVAYSRKGDVVPTDPTIELAMHGLRRADV